MKIRILTTLLLCSSFNFVSAQTTPGTLNEIFAAHWDYLKITDYKTESFKHLAMVKDGEQFTVLDAVQEYDLEAKKQKGGFQLRPFKSIGYMGSEYIAGKPAMTYKQGFNTPYEDYNTFVKTDYGYVACGPNILAVFGNDLQPLDVNNHPGYTLLSAAPLKGTSQIALLEISNAKHIVYLSVYDYKQGKTVYEMRQVIAGEEYLGLNAQSNRLLQTPDGNLFIALNLFGPPNNNTGIYELDPDNEYQIIGKISLAKLKEGVAADEFILWQRDYNYRLTELQIDADGTMQSSFRIGGETAQEEKLDYVTANTNANTGEEFDASISGTKTKGWDDSPVRGVLVRRLPDGRFVAIGRAKEKFGMKYSMSIVLYSKYLQVIRQYTYADYISENQDGQGVNAFATPPGQFSYLNFEPDGDVKNDALTCKIEPELHNDARISNDYYMGSSAVWDVLPGFTKDDLIILNAHQIMRLSLTKYTVDPNRY